jgi:hypothetical protein
MAARSYAGDPNAPPPYVHEDTNRNSKHDFLNKNFSALMLRQGRATSVVGH